MGPRVKKPRSGKAKDSPTSTEAEQEIVEGGDEKINEETESQEDVHKTEVDNGGEEAPPLKKVRGRQNVKKVPAKTKGAPALADEENVDEGVEKFSDDTGAEENSNKVTSDYDDEEAAPAKKGRGRTKRATKDEMVGKEVSNGEGELKEELEGAAPGSRKGRSRKKKVDDEPEVLPKKKDRGARKIEVIDEEEEAAIDEGLGATVAEESKQKTTKREKKQPIKKVGKSKKDHEEEKLVEEDGTNEKKGENGQVLEDQAEDEDVHPTEEGAGDSKPVKKTARGKTTAKATDVAAKKKPTGRGKKAVKGEDLTEDNDVPVDGKKLRVLVEHCKS